MCGRGFLTRPGMFGNNCGYLFLVWKSINLQAFTTHAFERLAEADDAKGPIVLSVYRIIAKASKNKIAKKLCGRKWAKLKIN